MLESTKFLPFLSLHIKRNEGRGERDKAISFSLLFISFIFTSEPLILNPTVERKLIGMVGRELLRGVIVKIWVVK